MISWSNPLLSSSSGGGSGDSGSGGGSFSGIVAPSLAYATLALDPATGDLYAQPFIAKGPDAVIQKLRCRFKFWRAEWFLDTRLGVPYREAILVKNPDTVLINFIYSQVLLTTPGVASVKYFRSLLSKPDRTLITDFEAVLEDGTILRAETEPFIISE